MWCQRAVMPKVLLPVHMSMVAAPVVSPVCVTSGVRVTGDVNVAGMCVVS
jgi:hypothetical protein